MPDGRPSTAEHRRAMQAGRRWQGVMTEEQLARYGHLVADGLEPDAASWLEPGSPAGGARPPQI